MTNLIPQLNKVLGSSYALYLKTHGFHWNVTGPHFAALHQMFEVQYTEMWMAIDDLAERILALGEYAPRNGSVLASLSEIEEAADIPLSATEMVTELLAGHQKMSEILSIAIEAASAAGDDVSEGMLIDRKAVHEKTAWMLNAFLS